MCLNTMGKLGHTVNVTREILVLEKAKADKVGMKGESILILGPHDVRHLGFVPGISWDGNSREITDFSRENSREQKIDGIL